MKLKRIVKDGELVLFAGDDQVLSIGETKKETVFEIRLVGSLRSDTVHELQDELESLRIMGFDLRVDMQNVTYLSAACADVFLKLQLAMDAQGKGKLVLFHVPESILTEMKSTGLSELLMIE